MSGTVPSTPTNLPPNVCPPHDPNPAGKDRPVSGTMPHPKPELPQGGGPEATSGGGRYEGDRSIFGSVGSAKGRGPGPAAAAAAAAG